MTQNQEDMVKNIDEKSGISFFSDVIKLSSGATLAQALSILLSPIIARIYGPESFGVLAIFGSITGILAVISCLRYEMAILLPKKDEEAVNILVLCLLSSAFVSIATALLIYIGQDPLLRLLNAQSLAPYIWLVSPSVFMTGIFLAFNNWNSRTRQFGSLSFAKVASSAASIGTQLFSGFAGYPTGGSLIWATLVGSLVSIVILGRNIWQSNGRLLKENVIPADIFGKAIIYKKFLVFDTFAAVLNTISWQLPVLLLSTFFSPTVVGFYSVGFMLIQVPMSLIGGSVAQIFFQRASDANINNELPKLVEKTFRYLTIVGMAPMLMLAIIGEDLFILFFGAEWAEAGIYVQILSIWALVWFISSPLSTIISVVEKQEIGLKLSMANFLTRLIGLSIGGILGNARISILLFSLSGIIVYSCLFYIVISEVKIPLSNIYGILLINLKIFAPIGVILTLLTLLFPPLVVVIVSFLALCLYYVVVLKSEPRLRNGLKEMKSTIISKFH
jgi:lipopolysaccharide exporter